MGYTSHRNGPQPSWDKATLMKRLPNIHLTKTGLKVRPSGALFGFAKWVVKDSNCSLHVPREGEPQDRGKTLF